MLGAVDGSSNGVGTLPNPLASLELRNAAVVLGMSNRKPEQQKSVGSVLDLACGRGGDLKKWALQGADVYVGVDISSQSVAECQNRVDELSQKKGKPRVGVVLTRSMLDSDLPHVIERALRHTSHGGGEPPLFDIISIQFACHYAMRSETELKKLMKNVDKLLVEGGQLIITSTDARCLRHHISSSGQGEFGNALYHIKFAPEALSSSVDPLDSLGLRYTFTLSSAVEACDEYVVHMPSLIRIAKEVCHLELAYHHNFGHLVHADLPAFAHLLDPLKVQTVSAEEWEAIQLYSAMVFTRQTGRTF